MKLLIASLAALVIIVALWKIEHPEDSALVDLGDEFPSAKMPEAAAAQFLQANFSLYRDLRSLPAIRGFTIKTGPHAVVMSNPGGPIQESDAIGPGSKPLERLIFAGISGDRGFIHLESGGMWISSHLMLFTIDPNGIKPIWNGDCQGVAAKNLEELRSRVASGACKHQFGRPVVQAPIKVDGTSVFSVKRRVLPIKFLYINSDGPTCPLPPNHHRDREGGRPHFQAN